MFMVNIFVCDEIFLYEYLCHSLNIIFLEIYELKDTVKLSARLGLGKSC